MGWDHMSTPEACRTAVDSPWTTWPEGGSREQWKGNGAHGAAAQPAHRRWPRPPACWAGTASGASVPQRCLHRASHTTRTPAHWLWVGSSGPWHMPIPLPGRAEFLPRCSDEQGSSLTGRSLGSPGPPGPLTPLPVCCLLAFRRRTLGNFCRPPLQFTESLFSRLIHGD